MNKNAVPSYKQGGWSLSLNNNRAFYFSSLALFSVWVVFCWQGIVTAIQIWYGNEIFNHGFFIVPGAFYLIYLKRKALLAQPIKTTPLALVVVIPALLLYVTGIAGHVQLFLHVATFTLLPALIWLMLGTTAARTIMFPLVFMLFSVPVGEQLIPYLQEIAADGSVALLRLTDVPLFRSGLYIEIPQGRFLVAEACSGVSFFIASFVIGSLYAYLNLVSTKRRIVFVLISLIFPILANIVRVYGIILIAYWTDMEHAAGADHLIYGWFFFAFVIICLLGIGELIREAGFEKMPLILNQSKCYVGKTTFGFTISLFIVSGIWLWNIANTSTSKGEVPPVFLSNLEGTNCNDLTWQPVVINADSEREAFLNECSIKIYTAWFSEEDNELVSDLHRLFDPERFSLSSTELIEVKGYAFTVYEIVSVKGEKLNIVRWYEFEGSVMSDNVSAKLAQLTSALLGEPSGGRLWILATNETDINATQKAIENIINKIEK